MRFLSWFLIAATVAGFFIFTDTTYADGKAFPMEAFPKTPDIPSQKAMILWRDKVETLIVESAFQTESPEVGWVLPLPANPTKIEVAKPGMLKSLSMSLRPELKIVSKNSRNWFFFILASSAALVIVLIYPQSWLKVIAICVFLIFVASITLPSLGGRFAGGYGEMPGIQITQQISVGNYDVTVLRADAAEKLSGWLAANKLTPLSTADKKVIDSYISDKWVFAVARIRKEGQQIATPHPIAVTFAAEKPIYPMKLTALSGGGKTRVELFIVADQSATAKEFQVVACDKFKPIAGGSVDGEADYYKADSTNLIIGNTDACAKLWPGCVVTKLTADLTPEMMTQDVSIDLSEKFNPARQWFYTAESRNNIFTIICIAGLSIVLIWLGLICRNRRKPKKVGLIVAIVFALLSLSAAFVTYQVLPVNEQVILSHAYSFGFKAKAHMLSNILEMDFMSKTIDPESKLEDIVKQSQLLNPREWTNPLTGKAMIMEQSPGNFSLIRINNQFRLTVYDANTKGHMSRTFLNRSFE